MIPISLKLSNFTSYGENPSELDFTKLKLAAISGLNGAGKSSLLDALTWCIWGTSRAGDSADALIHSGSDNMQVQFSFELDGQNFTIKRRRSKKQGGSTALELWGSSHNLTEGTIKTTQEKIIQILHLTFETFTNSSYLRQGHADEFTTKGPTDRKRILSDILGLSHYDKLEEKAKQKAKDAETKLQLLEYQLLEIETELSQKEEREESLSQAEEAVKKVEMQLKQIENQIRTIQNKYQTISQTIKLLEERKNQLDTIQTELQDIRLQISMKQKAQEEFQTTLSQKEHIEKNYKNYQKLQEEKRILEIKRSNLIKLKDQWATLQKVIITLEQRRTNKITRLQVDIKKLETENEGLQNQIDHLSKHKAICPTCGQTINKKQNEGIVSVNQKKIEKNKKEIDSLSENLKKCQTFELKEKKEALELEDKVKKIEQETNVWGEITKQIISLEKYNDLYMKLQQSATGVKTHQEAILDLKKIYLLKEKQAVASKTQLEQLTSYESRLQLIESKLQTQETIKQALSQRALELRGRVGEAKQLVSRSQQLEKLAAQKQAEKESLQKEKEIFEELTLAFGKKGIQAMIIEAAIPEIETEANKLLQSLTEGRMQISLPTQRETKTKLVGGEKGVVETLDIIISDEMGERAYEMYSGGEAFRVNFAIRLAISKLLTHRAGAKLQFLVIDEGFGSQDSSGRTKLVEAIDQIKNDFEKILVITHIEELKEEFPIRIEVSKNLAGSTFEVVGV